MKISLVAGFVWLISFQLAAQDWEMVKGISFDQQITAISTDQNQNIFLGGLRGLIKKYDKKGEFQSDIEFPKTNEITLIEAFNPLKLFLFYKQNQEFAYIERFVSSPTIYSLSTYSSEYVAMATIGMDHSIWILEQPQNILRKFNEVNQSLLLSLPLNNRLALEDVRYMKSYRDLLLVLDAKAGIYILDQYANLLAKYDYPNVGFVQVINDSLLFLSGNILYEIGIYDRSITEQVVPKGYSRAVRTDNFLFLFGGKKMDVYRPIPR